jgi:hypothetical protein
MQRLLFLVGLIAKAMAVRNVKRKTIHSIKLRINARCNLSYKSLMMPCQGLH